MLTLRVLVTGMLATVVSVAQAQMPAKDTVKGGKDHPLLTRFEGAKLVGYEVKQFDEATLPAGKRARIPASGASRKPCAWKASTPVSPTSIPKTVRRSKSCATTRRRWKRPV